jgi:hypothetical protein
LVVLVIALAGLATSSCNRGQDRFRSEQDGFSIRALPDWQADREKGSVIFRGPRAPGTAETSIVVRSVPLDRVRPRARDTGGLSEAVAGVLAGLPASVVSRPELSGHPRLEGTRYAATFEPPGKSGRYARTHVAVLGDAHLFHLMHTAPEGALDQSAALFDEVVASLREQ